MWNLPRSGVEPVSPALAGRFFTTGPPGKPLLLPYFYTLFLHLYSWKVIWRQKHGSLHLEQCLPLKDVCWIDRWLERPFPLHCTLLKESSHCLLKGGSILFYFLSISKPSSWAKSSITGDSGVSCLLPLPFKSKVFTKIFSPRWDSLLSTKAIHTSYSSHIHSFTQLRPSPPF